MLPAQEQPVRTTVLAGVEVYLPALAIVAIALALERAPLPDEVRVGRVLHIEDAHPGAVALAVRHSQTAAGFLLTRDIFDAAWRQAPVK
jgi:hypothetical protein